MSDALAIQIIATSGLVLVAMIGAGGTWLGIAHTRTSRRVRTIQREVQNDHTENLRDDIDGKHTENRSILLTIQRDIAWIMRQVADADDRLDHLETTIGKAQP